MASRLLWATARKYGKIGNKYSTGVYTPVLFSISDKNTALVISAV